MREITKRVNIHKVPLAIIISLLVLIYVGIGASTVSEMREVADNGYLDGVEVTSEGMVEVYGEDVVTYPKYRYAVVLGEHNQFNYALDGLSYTDTLGIGVKTFVFDYSWYGGNRFDKDKFVTYIEDNYWLMVFREIVFSNQLVVSLILLGLIQVMNYWLMPVVAHILTSMFGFWMILKDMLSKTGSQEKVQVYESRVLRSTVESYENSQVMTWVSGFIALGVSLYTVSSTIDSSVFVAVWVNAVIIVLYILNKIVVNHIKLVKRHKNKGEEDAI